MSPEQITYGIFSDGLSIVVNDHFEFPIIVQEANDLLVEHNLHERYLVRYLTKLPTTDGFQAQPLRHILSKLSTLQFERISRALQLLEWQKNHRFCSHCGTATIRHAQGEFARVCPACAYTAYPRVNPCVIVVITKGREILLARSHRFANGMFSLIAGFVEVGETLEQAVAREVKEEVGLDITNIRYVSSQPWPFPTNIMIGFTADYVAGDLVLQEDEIAEAAFYPFDQLPKTPPKGSIAHRLIQLATQSSPPPD